MKIAIIDGSPAAGKLSQRLDALVALLEARGHEVRRFDLRELDYKHCVGCFGCWTRTPGECVHVDDTARVCAAAINADFLLLASPIIMGFVSSQLKTAHDKMIPLIHPYLELVEGEHHHMRRYDHMPVGGLLLEPEADTDEEDIQIITHIEQRAMLNARSSLAFTHMVDDSLEEVANAIDSL